MFFPISSIMLSQKILFCVTIGKKMRITASNPELHLLYAKHQRDFKFTMWSKPINDSILISGIEFDKQNSVRWKIELYVFADKTNLAVKFQNLNSQIQKQYNC